MSEVAVRDRVAEVVATIDRPEFLEQLRQALPASVSVEKFTRTTKLSIQLNPDIVQVADKQSLFFAMVKCARDGLLPDGRQAALVKVKVKGKETVAYWPMIGGLRHIAAKHGFSLEAFPVYQADEFDYALGFDPWVTHKPPALNVLRGELIGAYAVATRLEDGRKFLDVMHLPEIEAVRETSRAYQAGFGPWKEWPGEMFRKTAARRLFKQLPMGHLEEHEARVAGSDEDVVVATAPVPALAGLPTVEESVLEEVEADEVLEPESA